MALRHAIDGTMVVVAVYSSGCIARIQFAETSKEGFIQYPAGANDKLVLEIDNQRQMPFFISKYPKDWRTKTKTPNGDLRVMKCTICW